MVNSNWREATDLVGASALCWTSIFYLAIFHLLTAGGLFDEDLDVDGVITFFEYLANGLGDGRNMLLVCASGISTNLAVEVPEIDPFGKFLAALALDVFAYLRTDGVCQACGFDLGVGEGEGLFHEMGAGRLWRNGEWRMVNSEVGAGRLWRNGEWRMVGHFEAFGRDAAISLIANRQKLIARSLKPAALGFAPAALFVLLAGAAGAGVVAVDFHGGPAFGQVDFDLLAVL